MKVFEMNYFALWSLLTALLAHDCLGCFTNKIETLVFKSGSSFYKECQCSEPGNSNKNLKWLDVHDQEIGTVGPGTQPNVYVERRGRGVSLYIPSVSKTISGRYKCVAEHDNRKHFQSYDIRAYDPMYFINTEANQYITIGKNSSINCEVKGESNPLITWYKEGENPFQITTDEKYEIQENGLLIKNVTDEDKGQYRCSASVLETGDEVEKLIDVEVMTVPTISELKVTPDKTMTVGETVTIDCVAEAIPHPEYTWKKITTKEIKNESWVQEANSIIFDSITAEDRGVYECSAENRAGKAKRQVTIEVLFPPEITEFSNVTAAEGSTVQVTCKAVGRPRPEISIIFAEGPEQDRSIVWNSQKVSDTEIVFNLSFLKVNVSHEGVYICNASNEVSSALEEMHLQVMYKPQFEIPVESIWGWQGKMVNLTCEHSSNPRSTVTWKFQGNDIPTSEQVEVSKLIAAQLNSNDQHYLPVNITSPFLFGIYECIAKNELGEAVKTVVLREAFPPPAIAEVTETELTATSVTFDIQSPEAIIGPAVIGFTAEYDEIDKYDITDIHCNRTWSIDRPFKLDSLLPNRTYLVRFAALNKVGVGAWSEKLTFTTPEKSVPEPPEWDGTADSTEMETTGPIRWKVPEQELVDYYVARYCPLIDGEIQDLLCKEERILSTTELDTNLFDYNTTYYIEVLAHNSLGNSTTIDIYYTTPEKLTAEQQILSAGVLIGVSVVMVFVCLLLLDLLLLCWKRQGILANCCLKKKSKRRHTGMQSRDKKGLLKDTKDAEDMKNGQKELDYNKCTGIITGKHSAV